MEGKLTFKYDRGGDILYVNKMAPYAEQESEELADEVISRLTILLPANNLLRGRLALRRPLGLSLGWCASGLFRSLRLGALRRLPKLLIDAVERSLGGLPYSLAGLASPFQRFECLRGPGPQKRQGTESESQTTLPPGHGHGCSLPWPGEILLQAPGRVNRVSRTLVAFGVAASRR
jgi:hypothetical protein